VILFDAASGRQNFVYHLHQLLEAGLAIGQVDDERARQIYALNDSDSVVAFDKTKPFGLWGKGMLHKQFGKAQRLACGSYQIPIDLYATDLDGDGLDELLVATTQLSSLVLPSETILDEDGAILWRRWLPQVSFTNKLGWLNSSCLIPVNPDHDNHIDVLGFQHSHEITFRFWDGTELVDHPGWPKNFYPFLPTPPVVGDVDGDGAEEILIGTYDPAANPSSGQLFVFALDGTIKQTIVVPGGLKHIPALADVDADGRLDVIYRSLSGQVYVQNFGATSTNEVSWATHRGNMHRDGNCGVSLFPPGTPLVTRKTSRCNSTSFCWTNSTAAECYRVFRAEIARGPFQHIATVASDVSSFTDSGLKPGWLYFYEVRAVYPTNVVPSAPFAILSLLNSNLIANAGFEENDNSHWDKWFTGDIEMTNMVASTNVAFQGRRSMRVDFQNQTGGGSIAQFNQYGIPDSTLYVTPAAFYSFGGYFKSGGISQPSEHWFFWASTRNGYDTNARPALPWPNYFTPHFKAGTAPTSWTFVNRTFQLPAGFFNVELGHGFSLSARGSGSIFMDNVFFRQIPSPTATNWISWVPFGSTWRYHTTTPPTNWSSFDFNDAVWASGTAKFGAGSGPTNTSTRLPQQCPAYYFRKKFVADSAALEELLLSATCTDDSAAATYPIRLFLNGTEVKASIETVTGQGNEVRYFDLTPFAYLVHSGTNSIAVQVGNYWSSWDDVAFDVSLKAVLASAPKPRLTVCNNLPGGMQLLAETPVGTVWQIQSSDSILSPNWRFVQSFTNRDGSVQTFRDNGQNGRGTPAEISARFYRLMPF
jgi:hypothetical protein